MLRPGLIGGRSTKGEVSDRSCGFWLLPTNSSRRVDGGIADVEARLGSLVVVARIVLLVVTGTLAK